MSTRFSNLECFSNRITELAYADNLRDDLKTRIHALQMQQDVIEQELVDVSATKHKELKDTLDAQLGETARLITKFQAQLQDLDSPLPNPAETETPSEPPPSSPSVILRDPTPSADHTTGVNSSDQHPGQEQTGKRPARVVGSIKSRVKRFLGRNGY